MKTNTLLLCSGIASALYAIILLATPSFFIEIHGLTTDAVGLLFLRCAGALCVGYVVLGLQGSKLKSEEGIRLAVLANFAVWLAVCCVMLYGKFNLPFNALVFADITFCGLFSILFAAKVFGKQ
ncbi:MAG: hypothetical protein K0S53_2638 [Bacteroidetes bacterium]|jgi:hypothetical protein|nr:hypothetical protein [Bacteroidota bacterium]MDF2452823.1 hypothetical protein [Bacteroidota bacterium]